MSDHNETEEPKAAQTQENETEVSGILEVLPNKSGQLIDPTRNGKTTPSDPFVPRELIKRFKLKQGNFIVAKAQHNPRHPNPKVRFIDTIDGATVEERKRRFSFQQMVSIAPDEQIRLEHSDGRVTTRIMDLFCPIGKGTRGLIVAPPRTGKTTLLHDIAAGVPAKPSGVPCDCTARG
jgi:transcription termination factor Rho